MSELSDFLKLIAEGKKTDPVAVKAKEHREHIQEVVKEDLGSLFSQLSALKNQQKEVLVKEPIVEEVLVERIYTEPPSQPVPAAEVNSKSEIDKYLTTKSFQQPNPDRVAPEIKAITDKIKFLEQAIGRIAAHGPGSGEVNLRWLDDVARDTIADNRYLRYSDARKKFIFDDVDAVGEYLTLWDTTNQTFGNSTPQLVLIGQTNGSRNISLVDGSKITFSKAGTYNIQYSLQAVNSDNAQWDVSVWLKKNGNNIADSNSVFTVPVRKNVAIAGKLIMTSPIPVDVVAGDYVQIYVHTDATTILLQTIPEDLVHNIPRTPSVIVVVNKL